MKVVNYLKQLLFALLHTSRKSTMAALETGQKRNCFNCTIHSLDKNPAQVDLITGLFRSTGVC